MVGDHLINRPNIQSGIQFRFLGEGKEREGEARGNKTRDGGGGRDGGIISALSRHEHFEWVCVYIHIYASHLSSFLDLCTYIEATGTQK